ncbi:MAG: helix-turn-helix domain-containing protein [Methylococcales bacterium]
MTPEQLRAARNWLGWTQQELATRSKVGLSTIKDFESGKRQPIANNVSAIKSALEAVGMRFGEDTVSGPIGSLTAGAP